jgi:biopolymer transport protein ExbD
VTDHAQMPGADEDEPIASINIIPFVDISLVLLIIFLLTAGVIAKASIPVELPRAASGGDPVESTVNIVLAASGDLFVDGKPITPEGMLAEIAQAARRDPKVRAAISADKSIRYERVIQVIDLVKRAGIDAFALNIERAAVGPP